MAEEGALLWAVPPACAGMGQRAPFGDDGGPAALPVRGRESF